MKFFLSQKNKKGFTIIELIVVVGIISILSMILVPSFIAFLQSSKDKAGKSEVRSAFTAACTAFQKIQTSGGELPGIALITTNPPATSSCYGSEENTLGSETIKVLGPSYISSKLRIYYNKLGVTRVEYNGWRYDPSRSRVDTITKI